MPENSLPTCLLAAIFWKGRYKVWQDIHRSSISSAISSRHGILLLRDVQTTGNKPRRRTQAETKTTQQFELSNSKDFL